MKGPQSGDRKKSGKHTAPEDGAPPPSSGSAPRRRLIPPGLSLAQRGRSPRNSIHVTGSGDDSNQGNLGCCGEQGTFGPHVNTRLEAEASR